MIKNKKRLAKFCFSLFLTLIMVSTFSYPKDKAVFKPRLSIKLTGGWGSAIPMGDINKQLESVNNNETFLYWRQQDSSLVVGQITKLGKQAAEWEAELRLDLGSKFSLGIATSAPFHKTNTSSVTYTYLGYAGPQIVEMTYSPEINVGMPVRLSAYYSPFHGSRLNVLLNAGIGVYPAKIREDLKYAVTSPAGDYGLTDRYCDTTCSLPVGFHAGFGVEFNLTKRLALVMETQWRLVKLTNFKGKGQYAMGGVTSTGQVIPTVYKEIDGTLYYFARWDLNIGARYADLEVWAQPPESSIYDITDVRKAQLDLSRLSVRIGLRIGLF